MTYLERWSMWMRAQSWSERTIEQRLGVVERVARERGSAPESLSEDDVLRFLSGSFSAATRRKYHVDLLAWFRWLVSAGVRGDNPMDRVAKPRAHRKPLRPISTAQLRALLESGMHARTRSMVLLGAYQGLRVHEIAKFRGADIDVRSGELHVVGKGGVDALLPLHPVIEAEAALYGPGWWFPQWTSNRHSAAGGPILGNSVSAIVSAAMRRAGVPGSAHSLRHWYASELLRQGVDIRVIQQLLRHASLATTELYLHVDGTERRTALLLLPDLSVDAAMDPLAGLDELQRPTGVASTLGKDLLDLQGY